jgi:hypothetical protein
VGAGVHIIGTPTDAMLWDVSVSACLEELRRWLCELLPECRVWLD